MINFVLVDSVSVKKTGGDDERMHDIVGDSRRPPLLLLSNRSGAPVKTLTEVYVDTIRYDMIEEFNVD